MARNAEKAMTALARWRRMKMEETQIKGARPYLAIECNNAREAELWRREVIKEIAMKVSEIQNPGLGEFRIRDLNDEINKLLREKRHWELRIKDLGGKDFLANEPHSTKILDKEGKEVPANPGYKYFGAAKDLPGVRELLQPPPPPPLHKKTRGELMKTVDAHYYGFLDEDDGILLPQEKISQSKAREKLVKEWKAEKKSKKEYEMLKLNITGSVIKSSNNNVDEEDMEEDISDYEDTGNMDYDENYYEKEDIFIPSSHDMELALLGKKKQELLKKIHNRLNLDE